MKITCNTALLSEACLNVQRAASQKSTMPALEGILLKTTDNMRLELSGYDLEMGINTVVDAIVKEEGGVILAAKTLCEILRHLPKTTVDIEVSEKNICTIKSEDAEFSLIGMPVAEFPDMPIVMGGIPVVFPQMMLKEMVRQTIFAVSVDDSKAVHKGIKFDIEDGCISLVALDGYRLAIRKESIEYKGEPLSFIVPAKTLSEVVKFINDENDFISVALNKHHIVFNMNGYNIVSRLLEGNFLNYKAAIPQTFSVFVRVNTREMIESIERISLVISEKHKGSVKCVFDVNEVSFSCSTAIGSANDRINAKIDGERLEIGFNSRFLLEALRVSDCDAVNIKMGSAVSPAVIVPIEGDAFIYLILPVSLKND